MYDYVNTMRIKCYKDTYLSEKTRFCSKIQLLAMANADTCDNERRYLRMESMIVTQ